MADRLVLDASAMVDLLVGSPQGVAIGARLRGHDLHVPAHFDAEVSSALAVLDVRAISRIARSKYLLNAWRQLRCAGICLHPC
jgi:predicted nucleic acid-binding protein